LVRGREIGVINVAGVEIWKRSETPDLEAEVLADLRYLR
jgi:hypothetical protein